MTSHSPDVEDDLLSDKLTVEELGAIHVDFQPLSPYALTIARRVLDGTATKEECALFNPDMLEQAKALLRRNAPDDERFVVGS